MSDISAPPVLNYQPEERGVLRFLAALLPGLTVASITAALALVPCLGLLAIPIGISAGRKFNTSALRARQLGRPAAVCANRIVAVMFFAAASVSILTLLARIY